MFHEVPLKTSSDSTNWGENGQHIKVNVLWWWMKTLQANLHPHTLVPDLLLCDTTQKQSG